MKTLPILMVLALTSVLSACEQPGQAAARQPAGEALVPREVVQVYMADAIDYGAVAGLSLTTQEQSALAIRVLDPQGQPAPGLRVRVRSKAGNSIADPSPTSDDQGYAYTTVIATVPGEDVLDFITDYGAMRLSLNVGESHGKGGAALYTVPALPEVEGALSWELLATVTYKERDGLLVPRFARDHEALDGQEVILQGFMLPLENSEEQAHFILTRSPPTCFYCMPGGPESVVEVMAERPLPFSLDPLVLSGRMVLLRDSEMGLFYRLEGAKAR